LEPDPDWCLQLEHWVQHLWVALSAAARVEIAPNPYKPLAAEPGYGSSLQGELTRRELSSAFQPALI